MRVPAYIVAIAMTIATSCSNESTLDAAAEALNSRVIGITAYSSTLSTKAPVIDNATVKNGGFNVGAYLPNSDQKSADLYIPCTHVGWGDDQWGYLDDAGNSLVYYWPALASQKLSFLAHYPRGYEKDMTADDGSTELFENEEYKLFEDDLAFSFGYTVHYDETKQFDLIYALRENVECPDAPPYNVQLDFCHALTQVGFTAELDPDLDVEITVYDVVIHNIVYSGTFVVKEDTSGFNNNGVWYYAQGTSSESITDSDDNLINEFGVAMLGNGSGVELGETSQNLTDPNDALMLMPQHITAWNPSTFSGDDPTKAGAYLAISCEITQHVNGETITIHQKENWLYTPLTTNITYPAGVLENTGANATECDWVAGYNIIYNLKFGGGYSTIPGVEHPVMTLAPMVISASVGTWSSKDGGELMSEVK